MTANRSYVSIWALLRESCRGHCGLLITTGLLSATIIGGVTWLVMRFVD